MRSVGSSPMLTFDSGVHQELKHPRDASLIPSEQKLALATEFTRLPKNDYRIDGSVNSFV